MNTMDWITVGVLLAVPALWLAWEMVVLQTDNRTISQIARQIGWRLSFYVFLLSSMPFHWWCPSPVTGTTAGTVTFWLIVASLFVYNIVTWRRHARDLALWPRWDRWVNWPILYLIAGPVLALLLFPQRQSLPWLP